MSLYIRAAGLVLAVTGLLIVSLMSPRSSSHALPVAYAEAHADDTAAVAVPATPAGYRRNSGVRVVPLGWLNPYPGQYTGPPDIISEAELKSLGER